MELSPLSSIYNGSNIEWKIFSNHHSTSASCSLVWFHGWMGSGSLFPFSELRSKEIRVFCPDLPGHGKSSEVHFPFPDALFQNLIAYLRTVPKPVWLAGYSMGARLAAWFALTNPSLVDGLVLESGRLGIEDASERTQRVKTDEERAHFIQSDWTSFVKTWASHPVLESPQKVIDKLTIIQHEQNPNQMGFWVEQFSPGKMPVLKKEAGDFPHPVLLITGEKDHTFTKLNRNLAQLFPHATHLIHPNAGHRVHLEDGEWYIQNIHSFIEKFL